VVANICAGLITLAVIIDILEPTPAGEAALAALLINAGISVEESEKE